MVPSDIITLQTIYNTKILKQQRSTDKWKILQIPFTLILPPCLHQAQCEKSFLSAAYLSDKTTKNQEIIRLTGIYPVWQPSGWAYTT